MTRRLQNIRALPHPDGNRIDISWVNPFPDACAGVKVLRREGTPPVLGTPPVSLNENVPFTIATIAQPQAFNMVLSHPDDAIASLDGQTLPSDFDELFFKHGYPLSITSTIEVVERGSKWHLSDHSNDFMLIKSGADSVNVYNAGFSFADKDLKAETVYYYSVWPIEKTPSPDPDTVDPRNLRNRVSAMVTGKYDTAGQMYDLLPAIYHRYDTALSDEVAAEEDKTKGALLRFLDIAGGQLDQFQSFAKSSLDLHDVNKVDGALLPLLAQWIGWKTDFRQEIDRQRNELNAAPSVYQTIGLIPNIEAAVKRISGWESRTKEFVHNVFLSNSPERLNLWSLSQDDSGEWNDEPKLFSLDYAYEGRPSTAYDSVNATTWLFYHTPKKYDWDGKRCKSGWNIWYKTRVQGSAEWSPSQPLLDRRSIDKYPTAAFQKTDQGNKLWVFWSVYDEANKTWSIEYRTRTGAVWSAVQKDSKPFGGTQAERKNPFAVVVDNGMLSLFWFEKDQRQAWRLKYNTADATGQWLQTAKDDFPVSGDVIADLFVLFDRSSKLTYLFWAQKHANGLRYIHYAYKNADGWTAYNDAFIPKITNSAHPELERYDDREPAAFVDKNGVINILWSSKQDGSWSIWQKTMPANSQPMLVTAAPFSQRNALPVLLDNGSLNLIFRSNESIYYSSKLYTATGTLDSRYAGSTSFDTKNKQKIELMARKQFHDFQTYTSDAKVPEDKDDWYVRSTDQKKKVVGWYARGTVGIFLTMGTSDQTDFRSREIVSQFCREMMPIQTRPAFICDIVDVETSADTYDGARDSHRDVMQGWVTLHSVLFSNRSGNTDVPVNPPGYTDNRTVDFGTSPTGANAKYRTAHTGLNRFIEED